MWVKPRSSRSQIPLVLQTKKGSYKKSLCITGIYNLCHLPIGYIANNTRITRRGRTNPNNKGFNSAPSREDHHHRWKRWKAKPKFIFAEPHTHIHTKTGSQRSRVDGCVGGWVAWVPFVHRVVRNVYCYRKLYGRNKQRDWKWGSALRNPSCAKSTRRTKMPHN